MSVSWNVDTAVACAVVAVDCLIRGKQLLCSLLCMENTGRSSCLLDCWNIVVTLAVAVVLEVDRKAAAVEARALGLVLAVGAACGSGGCTWLVLDIAVDIAVVGVVMDREGRFLCISSAC